MALSTIQNVRDMGRLPASTKLADAVIQPHLDSAARELRRWVGEYASETDPTFVADLKDAEQCITLAYLIPVLHSLYPEMLSTAQKELGEMDILFATPAQQQRIIDYWMSRARDRVRGYIPANSGGETFKYAAV